MTTKLDAPYTHFTIRARSTAPHSEEVNRFDLPSRDQNCETTANSRVNATSAANERMSAASRASAKMSFWNSITQRLQSLSLNIPKIGAIPVRPFATDAHCYSQAEPGQSQEALSEAEAEAEAASLERQLENLRIPTAALDNVDTNSAGFAGKIAELRQRLRALKSKQSKSKDSEAHPPGRDRVPLRVVRAQMRRFPMESSPVRYKQSLLIKYNKTDHIVVKRYVVADEKPQAKHIQKSRGGQNYFDQVTSQPLIRPHLPHLGRLGRYVKDGQSLPPPSDMSFRKMNVALAENNAFKSQLEIGKYHESEAGEETETSRGPCKNASNPSSPIRFISETETEDAHIKAPNKPGSELSEQSPELDVEPMEIRRHLSSGQTPKLPSRVRRIRRIPGPYFSKYHVAEKMITTREGNLLIRKHGVGPKTEERPIDLSHSKSVIETQGTKPDSPKDQARELHSKYGFTSPHDVSPEQTQKPREQYFTFRKHKSDAKSPIFVKASS